MFPLIHSSTRLKLVASVLAAIWVVATLRAVPFGWSDLAATSASGAGLAWLWYRLMDGPIPLGELLDPDATRARRLGWTALIAVTGCAAFYLHGRVAPLLPAGEWHPLLSRLFVAMVWPALMWPLPSLGPRIGFRASLAGAAR